MPNFKLLSILSLATLCASAFGQSQNVVPGTVNFVEGQAALNGKPLAAPAAGNVTLAPGGMLSTGNGHAAVVLSSGAYLQLSPSTVVRAVVLDKNNTEIQVDKGQVEVAVRGMEHGHDLQIDTPNGVQTVIVKNGMYGFDAKAGELRVFDGKAAVSTSDKAKWIDVKGGEELALNASATAPSHFDSRGGGNFDGFAGPGNGFADYGYGAYPLAYGFGDPFWYGPGYGFYGPYAYGFYPGFYGGYGIGFGGFRGGYGGFRGGYGGFRGRR